MDRLPGFRDFFPSPVPQKDQWEFEARTHLFSVWRDVLRRYGFQEYDGPPLEPLELFTKKSGDEIVGQLYNFEDKGGRAIALRPEMTPTFARMIAANERQYKKPMKWFSIPQLFRYERQQKGRLREHFQLNADIAGEPSVAADAELIALLIDVLKALELNQEDFVVRVSSRNAWQEFYRSKGGSAEDEYTFFQIIDKLERTQREDSSNKLQAIGISLDDVETFIQEGKPTESLKDILDDLRARGLDEFVKIDYGVIRGLAYYTGVVFEAFDKQGEFRAIAGGGRYDGLVRLISDGKTDLPSLGFGMGDVVLLELLRSRGRLPEWKSGVDVYCLVEDESHRPQILRLVQQLREAGWKVDYSLTPQKPNKQFKQATEKGAQLTLSIQQPEDADGQISLRLKRLSDRREEQVCLDACEETIRGLLLD